MGKNKKDYKSRIHFMDFARGVIIIGVVAYHTLYDLYAMYSLPIEGFLFHPFVSFIQKFGAGLLIFISGISCHLSRSNLKRGLMCLGVALGFSLFTFFLMGKENFIFFGVLHLLSVCMLMYALLRKFIDKIPVCVSPILFIIFLFIFSMSKGFLGFFGNSMIELPKFDANIVTYCLGLPWYNGPLYSADYFPVLPWIVLFLSGAVLGKLFKEGKIPKFFYKDICPPITFIGTKTIFIYVLHQPIVYGILYLVFRFIIK